MRYIIIGTCLVLAGAAAANAQQITRQQLINARAVCEADLRKFCSGIQPGGGRIAQCLKQNAVNLSKPCQDQLLALKTK